jgi:hypothetical protein
MPSGHAIPRVLWNLWSQDPKTCTYPEPDESSPYYDPLLLIPVFKLHSHLLFGLPNGLLPSNFPTTIKYAFLFRLLDIRRENKKL